MRAILQFVISATLCGSLLFAVVPGQAAVPPIEKAKCCAKAKAQLEADGCAHHAPKSDQEKQCCAGCLFCLAALVTPAAAFVYPPTGDESFRDFILRDLVRSDRPQVPPPRFSIVS